MQRVPVCAAGDITADRNSSFRATADAAYGTAEAAQHGAEAATQGCSAHSRLVAGNVLPQVQAAGDEVGQRVRVLGVAVERLLRGIVHMQDRTYSLQAWLTLTDHVLLTGVCSSDTARIHMAHLPDAPLCHCWANEH